MTYHVFLGFQRHLFSILSQHLSIYYVVFEKLATELVAARPEVLAGSMLHVVEPSTHIRLVVGETVDSNTCLLALVPVTIIEVAVREL